jgi:hypothetical protein
LTEHDVLNHHYRRYNARQLRQVVQRADLLPGKISYFNTWLFPAIASACLIMRTKRFFQKEWQMNGRTRMRTDFERNISWLNGILQRLFASERFVMRHASFPFGVSLMGIARKAGAPAAVLESSIERSS